MTRILFFGRVSDAAGCGAMNADLPDDVRTVGELRAWLAARDGTLADMIHSAAVRAAVDHTISHDDVSIIGAREIAFMSPMSGG